MKNNKTHSDRGLNSNSYPCVLATKESERVVEGEREEGKEGWMQPSGALPLLILPSEEGGRGCWQTGGGAGGWGGFHMDKSHH